jgi:carbon-monoxide dehydrogenase medium subunit
VSRIEKYLRASTIEEAIEMKIAAGTGGFYLAGGTDALVNTPAHRTTAIDIMRVGLDHVSRNNGSVNIGATALLCDIERHQEVRAIAGGALVEAIRETGPWLIRNAATLVGNLCNASPSADSAPMLLALDASLALSDGRVVPLDTFFASPHRTILTNELVTDIRLEPRGRTGVFHKLSRSKSDIAQVNLAVTARPEGSVLRDVRIALGSVAPTPIRARQSEQLLEGKPIWEDLWGQLAESVMSEVSPIDDWRATSTYRRHAAGVMVVRAVRRLVP